MISLSNVVCFGWYVLVFKLCAVLLSHLYPLVIESENE